MHYIQEVEKEKISMKIEIDGKEYYVWESGDEGMPFEQLDKIGHLKINIRSWYPGWLVGIITKFAIWKNRNKSN